MTSSPAEDDHLIWPPNYTCARAPSCLVPSGTCASSSATGSHRISPPNKNGPVQSCLPLGLPGCSSGPFKEALLQKRLFGAEKASSAWRGVAVSGRSAPGKNWGPLYALYPWICCPGTRTKREHTTSSAKGDYDLTITLIRQNQVDGLGGWGAAPELLQRPKPRAPAPFGGLCRCCSSLHRADGWLGESVQRMSEKAGVHGPRPSLLLVC